jgi:hypothetical protein
MMLWLRFLDGDDGACSGGGIGIGPIWFSFFLTSFSENLAVGRIWVLLGLRAEEDKDVHRAQDLESDGFLLLQQLNRLYVYVDFE